jgi:hypothetical protein
MCFLALCKILRLVNTYNVQVTCHIFFPLHIAKTQILSYTIVKSRFHELEFNESLNFKPIALHTIENISDFVELFQCPITLDKNRVWHNIWFQSQFLQFFENVHHIHHVALLITPSMLGCQNSNLDKK